MRRIAPASGRGRHRRRSRPSPVRRSARPTAGRYADTKGDRPRGRQPRGSLNAPRLAKGRPPVYARTGPRGIIRGHGNGPGGPHRKRTGFCYGVREAIDKAKEASAAGKATHTLGQVVHNEGVVRDLQARHPDRRHARRRRPRRGRRHPRPRRPPDVMARAERAGLEVIDGTCTWVIQEQKELPKLVEEGYTIVLLGTPKHPEVVGLLGFAPDAIVVDEEEEWEAAIPRKKRMALHQPVDPAALEVREARRVHGVASPRAEDRQHGLPGHDPPPAGHDGDGRRGRPDGRRRWPLEREHQGAHAAVRDRRTQAVQIESVAT